MHRYGLALLIVASPVSAFAAEVPKEGSYDYTSCWSGVNNVITFSKTHTASSFEMTGTNRSNPILPLPGFVGRILALPMGLLPKPLVTGEQITLLGIDNVVSAEAVKDKRTLQGIGIVPRPLDAVLESYIWRFSANGQFDRQTA